MTKDIIRRYIWLVDTICQAGSEGITHESISKKWEKFERLSGGEPYAWRTFMNHRKEISEIFDVEIVCNKSTNSYYIPNRSELSDAKGFKRWLLDTISVNNQINESTQLKDRILVEQHPSGQEFLSTILEAMREGKMLTFDYKPFWLEGERVSSLYHVEPYALKVFKRRWYLLAKYGENPLRIYALDRIQDIDIEFDGFQMPANFNAEDFFNTYFGVIISDDNAQQIQLKVSAYQSNYLRTLPLHHSQKETERTDEYSVFTYYLHPTFDLIQEILALGESTEVLAPKSLRQEVARIGKCIKTANR